MSKRHWVVWWPESKCYLHNLYDTKREAKEVAYQNSTVRGVVLSIFLPDLATLKSMDLQAMRENLKLANGNAYSLAPNLDVV